MQDANGAVLVNPLLEDFRFMCSLSTTSPAHFTPCRSVPEVHTTIQKVHDASICKKDIVRTAEGPLYLLPSSWR